jgi:hypothetical protein
MNLTSIIDIVCHYFVVKLLLESILVITRVIYVIVVHYHVSIYNVTTLFVGMQERQLPDIDY